jgi:tocopherol O-methyltransferase
VANRSVFWGAMIQRLGIRLSLAPKKVLDLSAGVARTWTLCIARFVGALPSRADYRRILFSRAHASRVFAKTIFRLRLAYASGAMRYGLFSASR